MELKDNIIDSCKQRMVIILHHYMEFCNNNNLRYYCSQGTALGVRRHKGFIPWDDDVDVMMPRPDYERFVKIYNNDNSDYQLVTPYNNENYYLPFAKLIDKKSTLIERRNIPCTLGLFIDIFPIDGMPSERNETLKVYNSYQYYRTLLGEVSSRESYFDLIKILFRAQFKRFFRAIKYGLNRSYNRDIILKELYNTSNLYSYDNSDYVSVEDIGVMKKTFPKEWLEPYMEMSFEGMKVRMPNNTDGYLTNAYGDFMQLPPEEERINNHMEALYYFNLNERKDYNDLKSIIKSAYISKILRIAKGWFYFNR